MGIEEFLLDRAKKEGRKEGKEEGRDEKAKEMALEMKKRGSEFDFIASVTGLSMAEIEKLS
jgi:predicted transposase/invertase (TIGR01784 family)